MNMIPRRYSKSLYIFATHEEVEAAVCGHLAESGASGKVRDWGTNHRFYIDAETCAERLRLNEITAQSDPTQGTGMCRIELSLLRLPEEQLLALSFRDDLRHTLVLIDCGGQREDAVQEVFVAFKVDEEDNGPLPEGHDHLRVFLSIKKRLLRTKAKGQFFGDWTEKPLRHFHWTEGVKRMHENGARLYHFRSEIRVVPG